LLPDKETEKVELEIPLEEETKLDKIEILSPS
jgi:hypothetical protein